MSLPVLSIAQMREWEKASWAAGQSEVDVIRRVGKAVARHALRLTRDDDLVVILAGKGHNGEDARTARKRMPDRRVDVLDVKDPKADFSKLETLLSLRPALVIDGLFGIGLNRPLDSAWVKFIERINAAQLPVLAVDVPSGLNADTGEPQGAAIEAAVTLTVGAPKTGLLQQPAWPHVGRLEVAHEVGLVPCPIATELNWILSGDFSGFPPRRRVASYKGIYGHLALIAGSTGYHGAAVLAARGAQRARPGLITLFAYEPVYFPTASQLQAVMVHPWTTSVKLPGEATALLVGPGLASPDLPEEEKRSMKRAWRDLLMPVVVDASALDWLPLEPVPKNAVRVITPHPGEAARLLKTTTSRIQADRPKAVRDISRRYGDCWVVLKGHQTLIGRSEGDIFVNSSGNPALAQGGSGDVLAGYLSGLLAQPALQPDALKTICFAVWQHGATADRLAAERRNWVVEDLVEAL